MTDSPSSQRDPFYAFARLFRRDLDESNKTEERLGRITSVLATVDSMPLALAGIDQLDLGFGSTRPG